MFYCSIIPQMSVPKWKLVAMFATSLLLVTCLPAQEVVFDLRTQDGRSEYRIGEPISLELVFTSASREYIVDTSSRYPEIYQPRDEISVEPRDGWQDPFADYRHAFSSQGFFDRGGLRGFARTGDKPAIVELRLNHFVRFTRPGQYLLRIKSARVSPVRRSADAPTESLQLESSVLRLTVVRATADWQNERLSTAMELLRKGPGIDQRACDAIESLGTEASEIAMALALESQGDIPGCSFSLNLIGAGHRASVLKRMQTELEIPTASVSNGFVESMVTLTALEERRDSDFFQLQADARKKISDALFDRLPEKKGAARIAAISTLVSESLNGSPAVDSARQSDLLRVAAANFEQLTQQARYALLSAKWKEIAGPAMVPVLRRCAEADSSATCGDIQGDILLTRLNELSPKDAREVILADILGTNRRFSSRELGMLPDKELPELDGVLLEHLQSKEGNVDTAAGLIARYASEGIAGAVASFLDHSDPGTFGGETQQNLIAYLYRVQPPLAEQRLRKALAAREGNGWYKYMLAQVAQRNPSANLQEVAIEALHDEDRDLVQSAVQALELTGDTRGKDALFERLQEWQAMWMGRKQEISYWVADGPVNDDRYLGDALFQAIGRGSGWLLNDADQRRLLRLALTENQKQTAEQTAAAARQRPVPFWVNSAGDPSVQILVGQYSYESVELAERKILQYPRGTVFSRQAFPVDGSEAGRTAAKLDEFVTANGMRLERPTAVN